MKNLIVSILLICFYPIHSIAQNNTSSPYSYYGIGDISNVGYGRNLGLGGTGYALRSSNSLNLKNPASLTAIDTLSVLYEMGVFYKQTYIKSAGDDEASSYSNGNLSHVVLGHRINNRVMVSYGIMPFSDIGYSFKSEATVEGENSNMVSFYKGSGGINKLFGNLGIRANEHFSLGLELGSLFGPITQTIKTYPSVISSSPSVLETNTNYRSLLAGLGMQYYTKLGNKGSSLVIGGMYKPAQLFYGKTTTVISQVYNNSSAVTIYADENNTGKNHIPMSLGGGASYTFRGKYLIAFDVEDEWWGKNGTNYVDRMIYSMGIEKLPVPGLNYLDRCSFRAGLRYDSGYIKFNKYTIDDTRITLGVGLPVKKEKSTINITLEAGQRGTMNMGLLRERYAKLSVVLSFHDYWFGKRKID